MVDDHLNDGVAIFGNRDVAFTTRGAQRVRTARFELRRHTAAKTARRAGNQKQFAAKIHAAMLTHKCAGRMTLRRYFGW
jgi:hypothetical protein